ncbi:MAG: hypothetical protein WC505_07730 [Patescibacteria group bacterium]
MKYRGRVRKNKKGETAVLHTPRTMCGWSTRARGKQAAEMMFCPEIVDLVLNCTDESRERNLTEILKLAKKKWPKVSLRMPLGLPKLYLPVCLEVAWVPSGALVTVTDTENIGNETVNIAYRKTHWEV